MIRYPAPLRPGDVIGVTAPSSGVPEALLPRLDLAVEQLRERGYEVRLGRCLVGDGVVSAPAAQRAAELTELMTDPQVRAVVPPWGGELAVELLPHLDLPALAADPTWLVGFSDLSTLLLPFTTTTGVASVHGQNLMDLPDGEPEPLLHWLDVLTADVTADVTADMTADMTAEPGTTLVQGSSHRHAGDGFADWADDPTARPTLDREGSWSLLDPGAGDLRVTGRLVGGCIETVSTLAGTPWGDVRGFAEQHAPEGLVVHVEASESHALDIARALWRLRLAGWFEHANVVLVGRTRAPAAGSFTQLDAVRSALGDLDVPVVLDVDCGHVAPHLALVQGARAEVVLDAGQQTIRQTLD